MSPLPLIVSILTTPWADAVISYDEGIGPAPGYTQASAAIGEPSRFTGEGRTVAAYFRHWILADRTTDGRGAPCCCACHL